MTGPRVLVVDDEPQILRAVSANLRGAGYDVETAAPTSRTMDLAEAVAFHVSYPLRDFTAKVCEKSDYGEDEEQWPDRIHREASIEEWQSNVEAYNRISYQPGFLSSRVIVNHQRKSEERS